MRDRIEEQIGQHLAVRSGIAVHRQVGLALDVQATMFLGSAGPKPDGNLFGQVAEVEWRRSECFDPPPPA